MPGDNEKDMPRGKSSEPARAHSETLGHFTTTLRVLPVSALAMGIGVFLDDLLKARPKRLKEERRRERTLNLEFLLPGGRAELPTK